MPACKAPQERRRKKRPALRVGGSNRRQARNLSLGIVDDCGHFVADTKVQRQVRTEAPVVLDISGNKSLPKFPRRNCAGDALLKMGSLIGEQCRERWEFPQSPLVLKRFIIVLHPFNAAPEFQGVSSMGPESVVIELIVVKGVKVIGAHANATGHPGIPFDVNLRCVLP